MKKYALFDIDTSLLKGYKELETLNPKNWDVSEYINLNYDVNAAIAISKLYFPDFIEKEGCIIMSMRYDENTFRSWKKKFNEDIPSIERYCNLYEVSDYFHLNKGDYTSHELYNKTIDEFSRLLKISWEINCQLLFPQKKIIVEVFSDYGTKRITIYTNP